VVKADSRGVQTDTRWWRFNNENLKHSQNKAPKKFADTMNCSLGMFYISHLTRYFSCWILC